MPEAVIHAPVRERNMTRSWEIEYAQKKNVPIKQSLEKIWSIDENLWGRSIEGGRLEEPDFAPPAEIFQWTKDPVSAANDVSEIAVEFENGVPVSFNGNKATPAQLSRTPTWWPARTASAASTSWKTACSASKFARTTSAQARPSS